MFQILVHDKAGRRTVRAFEQDRVSVGRSPDNDVVLADASVSKAHAAIDRRGDRFFVSDLGSTNGVFIDGERALGKEPVVVEAGTVIGIGDFTLTLTRLDEEPAQTFRIGITEPGGRHHVFAVKGEEVTIGADAGCDLQLEGEGVASRHARVVIQSDRLVLADLKSPSGTWKNEERLSAPQVVHEGDIVRVGCFHVTFARPGQVGPISAPPVTRAGDDRTLPTAEPDEPPARSSPSGSQPPDDG